MKSRKFLVAVTTALALVISDLFGIVISPEVQASIVSVLAIWIIGEAAVDAADRFNGGKGRD